MFFPLSNFMGEITLIQKLLAQILKNFLQLGIVEKIKNDLGMNALILPI